MLESTASSFASMMDEGLGRSRKLSSWILWSVILSGLVLLLYGPIFRRLVQQWWIDPDYGHGFFVPLFSAYVLWCRRKRFLECPNAPRNLGLLIMIGAIALLVLGSLGAELFISRFSFLVLLMGMILFLAGSAMLRTVFFPLGFLTFMIPIPVIIYNQITFPLQLLASRLASVWLEVIQVPVLRDGNVLVLSNYSLEVVEACSGIRSLMTLISLAVAYGYFFESRRSVRYLLVFLTVPIAIVTNAVRIMGAGLLAHQFGPGTAEGFLHEVSGWVTFVASLGILFFCHWVVQHIRKQSEGLTNA